MQIATKEHKGRKKGTPNNITHLVKHSIIDAFKALGGLDGFVEWGKENRTEFYKIYAKLLPAEMKKDVDDAGGIVIQIVQFKNVELKDSAHELGKVIENKAAITLYAEEENPIENGESNVETN